VLGGPPSFETRIDTIWAVSILDETTKVHTTDDSHALQECSQSSDTSVMLLAVIDSEAAATARPLCAC
jgi:hypothetical protein